MLDHLVAGAQPAGLSPSENVVKEAGEEAGVPVDLAKTAVPVSICSYVGTDEFGQLKRDVLFNYDLQLPWDFEPTAVDGEVESFERWPLSRWRTPSPLASRRFINRIATWSSSTFW